MAVLLVSIFLLAVHLVLAGNRLTDLFTKSRRNNKFQWMMIILLVPFIGVVAYNLTMRRQKASRKTLLF
ncbi:MAG: PLDc N-terminal domain-containing protein [Cyclobacteriaceae bacterium]|nr:PLDc N-terminal domain-containing protein [Cyclobacteriaceae bacterium]